jgi:hypothetical protein
VKEEEENKRQERFSNSKATELLSQQKGKEKIHGDVRPGQLDASLSAWVHIHSAAEPGHDTLTKAVQNG